MDRRNVISVASWCGAVSYYDQPDGFELVDVDYQCSISCMIATLAELPYATAIRIDPGMAGTANLPLNGSVSWGAWPCGEETGADVFCSGCRELLWHGLEEDSARVDETIAAYVECALWSSTDDGGSPMDDTYGPDDIDPDSLAEMRADVVAFCQAEAVDLGDMDPEQVGHDFWLTRNRHGAGFWDRGLGERGKRLTDAAHVYGESDLYVGDDGMVYAS
jgi:hypothetical protein